ncbi:MAG: HPr family phosphocarrier protein [Marvinbryantia sp.]|uniref:HPr family phosphocarrier protein n=1 Tax=Marvinbryantia sp. TaxID=2496532 RepID=UPI0025EC9D1C|nr:HPr family phosphocarrier protein [uncultured Marvinbryantia sp.]
MVSQTFVIRNHAGLHLKPAAMLCTEAIRYKSAITLSFADTQVNAKSVLSVLSACVKCNDSITISCDGPDEGEALENLGRLIMDGLGE